MKPIFTYPKFCLTALLLIVMATTGYGQQQPAKRKSVRLSANAGFFNEWANPVALNSDVSTPNHGQFIGASLDYFFVGRWFSRFGLHLERVVEDDLGRKKEGSFVTHKFSVTNRGTKKSFGYLSSFLAFGRSGRFKLQVCNIYFSAKGMGKDSFGESFGLAWGNEKCPKGISKGVPGTFGAGLFN